LAHSRIHASKKFRTPDHLDTAANEIQSSRMKPGLAFETQDLLQLYASEPHTLHTKPNVYFCETRS
jgi:hypothetical protein